MTRVVATRYESRTAVEPPTVPRVEPVVWGPAEVGPWDAEQIAAFDRRGFLADPALLSFDELTRLESDLCTLAADASLVGDERVVPEPGSREVRSIFEVHRLSETVDALARHPKILDGVRQILGSDVYLHQSRVNFKPGLRGKEFYWHSDFETWHHEDGMPTMRAVSVSVSLTDNTVTNGGLMIMPGSHRTFVGCVGETPDDHYRQSLRAQHYGTPSDDALRRLAVGHGIELITGEAGSAVFFDCNCMHGSNSNITPFPRSNVFLVFNSVENALVDPFGGTSPRPSFIAAREVEPLG